MYKKIILNVLVCLSLVAWAGTSWAATTINFENLYGCGASSGTISSYQGLIWSTGSYGTDSDITPVEWIKTATGATNNGADYVGNGGVCVDTCYRYNNTYSVLSYLNIKAPAGQSFDLLGLKMAPWLASGYTVPLYILGCRTNNGTTSATYPTAIYNNPITMTLQPPFSDPSIWTNLTELHISSDLGIALDNIEINMHGANPVPLPGSLILMGSGLLGLLRMGRKKISG